MNTSVPDCETHREDNYLWSHLVSVLLNKVFTFSMSHSSALCGWLWLCDPSSKFRENNIPQISTRRNWLKKAKSQCGLLWAYLKDCAYVCVCLCVCVCVCVCVKCEWVNEEHAKGEKIAPLTPCLVRSEMDGRCSTWELLFAHTVTFSLHSHPSSLPWCLSLPDACSGPANQSHGHWFLLSNHSEEKCLFQSLGTFRFFLHKGGG